MLVSSTTDRGQVIQLPTGEAAFQDGDPVSASAYSDALRTAAKATVAKATSVVMLAGQDAYWNHTNNNLTYKPSNGRDFRAGVLTADADSAGIFAVVDLGKPGAYKCNALVGPALSTTAGTVAAGGFDRARMVGGCAKLLLSATNEAQKVDLLAVDVVSPAGKWILEAMFRVVNGGAAGAPDFSIGLASATHATDADSIAEHAFIHLDGNALLIKAQSKDGTTTVAAVDTTQVFVVGSAVTNRVHVLIDGRNTASVKFYVNGVAVNTATTFQLDNATGPLFPIAHLEKTAAVDAFEVDVDLLRLWTSEQ